MLDIYRLAESLLKYLIGIAFCGICGIFALNLLYKDEVYKADLSFLIKDIRGYELPLSYRYIFDINAPQFKSLFYNNLASIKIDKIMLDSKFDSTQIKNVIIRGDRLFFDSIEAIDDIKDNAISYTISFAPSIKILVLFLMLLIIFQKSLNKSSTKKDDYIIAAIFAVFVVILCVGKISSGHNWGGDFALYISQAKSIVNGTMQEIVANNQIIMDSTDNGKVIYGPYAYPWGFPLLLAPVYKAFGFDLNAFKIFCIVSYALFVAVFYVFCARRFPRIYSVIATLLFALNPTIITYAADSVGSDLPFLLFSFVAMITIGALLQNSRINVRFLAICGGFLMAFACILRTNGIVIPIALFITHCIILINLKVKWLDSALYKIKEQILPYAVFIICYAAQYLYFPKQEANLPLEYAKNNISISSILENIAFYKNDIGLFFSQNHNVGCGIFALCSVVIILGIIKGIKKAENIFYVLCACGFIALLFLYPDTGGFRYVFSILPLLVYFGVQGTCSLFGVLVWFRAVILVMMCFVLSMFVYVNATSTFSINMATITYEKYIDGRAYNDYALEVWEYIRQNTPDNAVILFFKPRVLYLQTQRLGFASDDLGRLKDADFMLWHSNAYNAPIDASEFKRQTKLIFENADFKLYKIIK